MYLPALKRYRNIVKRQGAGILLAYIFCLQNAHDILPPNRPDHREQTFAIRFADDCLIRLRQTGEEHSPLLLLFRILQRTFCTLHGLFTLHSLFQKVFQNHRWTPATYGLPELPGKLRFLPVQNRNHQANTESVSP